MISTLLFFSLQAYKDVILEHGVKLGARNPAAAVPAKTATAKERYAAICKCVGGASLVAASCRALGEAPRSPQAPGTSISRIRLGLSASLGQENAPGHHRPLCRGVQLCLRHRWQDIVHGRLRCGAKGGPRRDRYPSRSGRSSSSRAQWRRMHNAALRLDFSCQTQPKRP